MAFPLPSQKARVSFPTFFPHFSHTFPGLGLTWPRCIFPGKRRRALGCRTLRPGDSGNYGEKTHGYLRIPPQFPGIPAQNPTCKQNIPFQPHPEFSLGVRLNFFSPDLLKILLQIRHSQPGMLGFVGILTSLGSCGRDLSFPINCRAGKWERKRENGFSKEKPTPKQ